MAAELIRNDERVLYLYGITETRPANLIHQAGIGHSKIEGIDCGQLVCWVSRVSAVVFEKELAQRMENLDWVAETSVAHQRAISTIARNTDILPARLATVFRSENSLLRHIRKGSVEFKQDLRRVKGADEWGVKVFGLARRVTLPKIRTGKDFLKAKAALLPKRGTAAAISGELAEFREALQGVALESASSGNVSAGQQGLILQTSLLVKRSSRKKLESVLNKFSKRWATERRIECTGPWPPYSFVSRVAVESD